MIAMNKGGSMRSMLAATIWAFALLAASPARAANEDALHEQAHIPIPRLSLGFFLNTGFQQGRAFSLFSGSSEVTGPGLAAEIRLAAGDRLGLAARAEVSHEEASGGWSQGSSQYRSTSFAVGGLIDVGVLRYLRPYAQLTVGMSAAEVRLSGDGERGLKGDDSGVLATGALGLRAISKAKSWWMNGPAVAVSGFVEGGYTVAGDYEFRLHTEGTVHRDDIQFEEVSLGQLKRSRAHMRLGASVHF